MLDLFHDSYYQAAYSGLYLSAEDTLFEFHYEEAGEKILFRSIKKRISHVAGQALKQPVYDLESHYGYAGPLSTSNEPEFLQRAFCAYRKKCAADNIVCEFIRFHPYNSLSKQAQYFDFHALDREVVVVDLTSDTPSRWQFYSKTTRNILRKAQQHLRVAVNELAIDDFMVLYGQTMEKNKAEGFYYFSPQYFKTLTQLPRVELLSITSNETLIACGYFMYGRDLAHYHLSANNSAHLKENGNYLLLDAAFERAKALGCQKMLLGGGRTSDACDSLLQFKQKFSHETQPFYIAGLDFLPDVKQQLNALCCDSASGYFQPYRRDK
ncbi:MAG: GNAT family N-acetyltransferase [Legionellales bacterium]